MKRKDFAEMKGKTVKELIKLVSQKRTEATKKKMEILAGKEKNIKAYKNLRREVAKILTLIREKEILEKLTAKVEVKAENKEEKPKIEKVEEVKVKKEKKTK